MNFNQVNNNKGDVNNAITAKGNVVQTVGSENKVTVDHPKEGFWPEVWKKFVGFWTWLLGKRSG
jgi:hypothetical protein